MRIISHLKVCSPATFHTLALPNPRLKRDYRNKPPKSFHKTPRFLLHEASQLETTRLPEIRLGLEFV
jgi:hypothetical protein